MLKIITDYAVPSGVFALMLIVGTEIVASDFKRVAAYPKAVLLGVAGQLVVLPPLVLGIAWIASIDPSVTAWLLLLSLCPGGAISNYYCYLSRCNVPLSATITAIGTICSLVSIPLWIVVSAGALNFGAQTPDIPTLRILSQLVIFMIVPMALGMVLLRQFPDALSGMGRQLRWLSLVLIAVILVAATWTVRADLATLAGDIAIAALLFILGALLFGRALAIGMKPYDGQVLIFESSVRNIGVALIVGRNILDGQAFATFASFLAGYFIIEIIVLLPYAMLVRKRLSLAVAAPQRL